MISYRVHEQKTQLIWKYNHFMNFSDPQTIMWTNTPRQKTKRYQSRNQNGAATNSTAKAEHKDWKKRLRIAMYVNYT